jgi:lysophospholipase L1-like esterase
MFGDSLIEGVGATEGNDLPSLLSKKLGQKVINMGMRGQTSAQGLARIGQVIKHDPKVVMVLFGGNDYLHQVPKEETFRNIDKIVGTLQGYGAVVVLLGIQGGILEDPYREEFRRIAHNRGTLYVPDILGGVIGEQDLMFDEVHPNDKGYEILAEKIYPIVKKGI